MTQKTIEQNSEKIVDQGSCIFMQVPFLFQFMQMELTFLLIPSNPSTFSKFPLVNDLTTRNSPAAGDLCTKWNSSPLSFSPKEQKTTGIFPPYFSFKSSNSRINSDSVFNVVSFLKFLCC